MNSSKTTLTESPNFLKFFLCTQTKKSRQLLFSLFLFLSFVSIPTHLLATDPCTATDLLLINDCSGFDTTTVAINGVGASVSALNGTCGTPNVDVAWVTFTMDATSDVIQWEMIGTDVSYELYYSSTSCSSLIFLECDDEFTGFKQIAHPTPGTAVDFYLAISEDASTTATSVDIALEACMCNMTIAPSSTSPVCEGTPYTLEGNPSGTAPYSYFWTDSLGFTANSPNPTTGTGAGVGAYTYYLKVIDSKGCSLDTFIVADVLAIPELVGRDTTICLGATVDLSALLTQTASGDSLEYGTTYGNYNLNDSLVTPTGAGTFTYFIRDSIGTAGCVDTAVVNITVNLPPDITGRDTTICEGETIDLSTLITQTLAGDSLEVGTSFGSYPLSTVVTPVYQYFEWR